jgi:acyl-coenzyme A thioesterase PaaI-like protein
MSASSSGPSSSNQEGSVARRDALARLAASIRRLSDAAVSTAIEPSEIDEISGTIEALTERLGARVHKGPYSGLMGRKIDTSSPARMLPLSPIVGPYNPIAPDVELRFDGARVRGRARLGKKHIGPPNCAHGGIGAMIADQLVALAGANAGLRAVTRTLSMRFRRPIPLYEELELEAWCVEVSDRRATVAAEIRSGGEVRLEIEGEMVEIAGFR